MPQRNGGTCSISMVLTHLCGSPVLHFGAAEEEGCKLTSRVLIIGVHLVPSLVIILQ